MDSRNKGVQFDDVDLRGHIIGGTYLAGNLFYEGRPQGRQMYALDEPALIRSAHARLQAMQTEFGEAFRMIYPSARWQVRIFA